MRRRDFLAATPAAIAMTQNGRAATPAGLETEIVRLKLRHTWTTVMSSSEFRDTLHVRLKRDGITGTGEGAPIVDDVSASVRQNRSPTSRRVVDMSALVPRSDSLFVQVSVRERPR